MNMRSRLGLPLRGRRRVVSLASAGALVVSAAGVGIAVLVSGSASAQPGSARHPYERVPSDLVVSQKPLGLATGGDETVVVELAGDPVTVTEENSGTPMTDSQRKSNRDRVRDGQASAEQGVKSLGGTVLGSYQLTYNGLKVRIKASQESKLLDIPGVVAVHPVKLVAPDNTHGVPLIGAPGVWDGLSGLHGEGVKVAVIDTGIDWTHADFGGPGTAAAYTAAHANETAPANPAYFGPNAPKVKGGTDLVGDSYNADPTSASYQPVPHPDPNPLDCNGHGSHVAGTAVGLGVLSDGTTYNGPYNASTISGHSWLVGPGVAPKASLYSVRVFGCGGSADTGVIVDAIEWAVDHRMDVINMSLGSSFGGPNEPDAVAVDNATRAGVIVVASAGNDGFVSPYMTGSPASATSAISVAAIDPTESFPGTNVALSTGTTLQAINANGIQLPDGTTRPVVVLKNANGGISLGCDPNEYVNAGVSGKIVVTARGTCARVARAIFGQQAGAAAVLMVNNAAAFPPFEGPITSNPDTGEPFTVTIPFIGVPGTDANRAALLAADNGSASLTANTVANPDFGGSASFTSGGPRTGDSGLKPDVAAPGVSIASVAVGTGTAAEFLSGTSMASPHTAGLAALVKQANPNWRKVENYKAAIVNTADPSLVAGYNAIVDGVGLVQAGPATATKVVAIGDRGTASLNFGFQELTRDLSTSKTITLRNLGNQAVTFAVGSGLASGSPHTVSLSRSSVTVPARGEATVRVTLSVPVATAGTSAAFADVAGQVTFTPNGGANGGVALRVPYLLVPQAVSHVDARLDVRQLVRTGSATATVTNRNGATTGAADWYAWGLHDGRDRGLGSTDIDSVGVESFPDAGVLVFAVSGKQRWSTAADKEFDIPVDVNGDGTDDYLVFSADLGLLTAGTPNGQVVTGVANLTTGDASLQYFAGAPTDSSSITIPVDIAALCGTAPAPCLTATNPRFSYHASVTNLVNGLVDDVDGVAKFNAFTPSVSTGGFDVVAPGATATEAITYNATEFAQTPALGFLIISQDNGASSEAETFSIR